MNLSLPNFLVIFFYIHRFLRGKQYKENLLKTYQSIWIIKYFCTTLSKPLLFGYNGATPTKGRNRNIERHTPKHRPLLLPVHTWQHYYLLRKSIYCYQICRTIITSTLTTYTLTLFLREPCLCIIFWTLLPVNGPSGKVAIEDVVYVLHGLGIKTNVDLTKMMDTGNFICNHHGPKSSSKVVVAFSKKRVDAA